MQWCDIIMNGSVVPVYNSNMRLTYAANKKVWRAGPYYIDNELFVIYVAHSKVIMYNSSDQIIWHDDTQVSDTALSNQSLHSCQVMPDERIQLSNLSLISLDAEREVSIMVLMNESMYAPGGQSSYQSHLRKFILSQAMELSNMKERKRWREIREDRDLEKAGLEVTLVTSSVEKKVMITADLPALQQMHPKAQGRAMTRKLLALASEQTALERKTEESRAQQLQTRQ